MLLFVLVFAWLVYVFFSPNYYTVAAPHYFVLHRGENFTVLTQRLKKEHVVKNTFVFKVAGVLLGGSARVVPGKYEIPNGLSYVALAEYFILGKCDREIAVHFPDGSSTEIIAARLAALGICHRDSFYAFYRSPESVRRYKIKADSLIGYLMPGDYTFYERSRPEDVVDSMVNNFNTFFDESKVELAENLGLSKKQLITLASIVDGETRKVSEMSVIAGVYLNRLRIGMKLQADPTLQFARGGPWGRVDGAALRINSPYNTYRYQGLPPGPIGNPGKAAINASLFPMRHDYLFFVADGTGGHTFSKSYTEHKKKASSYINRVYGHTGKK